MEILKNASQINLKLNQMLGKDYFFDNEPTFIAGYIDDADVLKMVKGCKDFYETKESIDAVSELVFQLKDYLFAVGNLVKMFLYAKSYNSVYYFVSRIFISHIGQINYTSTQNQYSFTERYFDRFIEIMKNCEVKYELFMPLILDIFRTDKVSGIAQWKSPAVEYLQRFFNQNEEWSLKFLIENPELKYELLKAISEFNTPKGIKLIIDDICREQCSDRVQALHVLKKFKRETLNTIDKEIGESEDARRKILIQILLDFDNDTEVSTRLHDLYIAEKNPDIKSLIATKIGITETMSIKTEKQYMFTMRKTIKEPQERSLGVPFDKLKLTYQSGFEVDNAGKTFLILLFKEEKNLYNLFKLDILKNIFNLQELSSFAYALFDNLSKKEDILQAKWCLRMCAVLVIDQIAQVGEYINLLLQQNREKEAKYFIECLIYAHRPEVEEILLQAQNNKNEFIKSEIENLALAISETQKRDIDEILDMLAPDVFDKKELEKQKQRLFKGFISTRTYTQDMFNAVFTKPLFLTLAKGLVFGEYAFGRLYNAFVFDGEKKYFICGKELDEPLKVISIIHSQDCDSRFDGIRDYIENPTFEQFAQPRFNVNEFSRASISVNRFCGMFVSLGKFTRDLLKKGFSINRAYDEIEFTSFVHVMPKINLIAELMLENPAIEGQESATLGMVHFVRFGDVLIDKDKYITTKENSVSVGSLPSRYFAYVMDAIYDSANTLEN